MPQQLDPYEQLLRREASEELRQDLMKIINLHMQKHGPDPVANVILSSAIATAVDLIEEIERGFVHRLKVHLYDLEMLRIRRNHKI